MAETLSPVLSGVTERRLTDILKTLSARNQTLATAESCTGGLLSSLFTDVPGHSHVFLAGFVTYADAAKTQMLGVPADLIAGEGAVSEAVARAMVAGALARAGSDFALAVTGFAGASAPGEEAGLVHFAFGQRDREIYHEAAHFGDQGRGGTRLCCIDQAVELMHRLVLTSSECHL